MYRVLTPLFVAVLLFASAISAFAATIEENPDGGLVLDTENFEPVVLGGPKTVADMEELLELSGLTPVEYAQTLRDEGVLDALTAQEKQLLDSVGVPWRDVPEGSPVKVAGQDVTPLSCNTNQAAYASGRVSSGSHISWFDYDTGYFDSAPIICGAGLGCAWADAGAAVPDMAIYRHVLAWGAWGWTTLAVCDY